MSADFEEEEFPEKYSCQDERIRRKNFNKISRNFESELKVAFGNNNKSTPFDLDQIYYAKSPSSSLLQYPVSLDQLDTRIGFGSRNRRQFIEPTKSEVENRPCEGVFMEKLDETQQIRNLSNGPFGIGTFFELSLRPITKSIPLRFNGARKFETEIDYMIEQHFDGQVTRLDAKDLPGTGTLFKNKLKVGGDHLQRVKPFEEKQPWALSKLHKTIFDEQNHSILVIPAFTRQGFSSFDMKEQLEFPFEVEFHVDGHVLQHSFNLPLTFQPQPQRLRLKFRFTPDGSQIDIYSHFMIYSIIPTSPAPTTSASVNVFEKSGQVASLKQHPTQAEFETERLVKNVLGNQELQNYWGTGKRLRYNSVPMETISRDGYMIGFNYIYEIKPKPNTEWKIENHRRTHQKRTEIRSNIKCDLRDYEAN